MPTVYVTNQTGYLYDSAESLGELVFITKGYVDFRDLAKVRTRLNNFIKGANKDDYLLLSGNNLLCSIATHDWLRIHGICRLLHWNPTKNKYTEYTLTPDFNLKNEFDIEKSEST
jgi:hypothetical protein